MNNLWELRADVLQLFERPKCGFDEPVLLPLGFDG
jgi:hypothetical protein